MKKIVFFLSILFTISIAAQKEANVWYFGQNAGIDFSSEPPVTLTGSDRGSLRTLEGCSSFSNSEGKLLFYSDGVTVYNANHQVMTYTNGNPANDLKGDPSSTQSGMIIPKPGSDSIYYLFTVDDPANGLDGIPEGLKLYTIDMSLNNGLGQLIDEDNDGIFFKDLSDGRQNTWTEKVAAVKGNDCNTYWVVSAVDQDFYSYKVTSEGVNLSPVITSGNIFIQRRGYLKISPSGTKMAVANQGTNFVLYNFDNSTGKITSNGNILIPNPSIDGEAYGVEFSRDSKKLYVSTVSGFRRFLTNPATTYKLFQFDLEAENIPNSKRLIYEDNDGFRGALQLGPNGKIYATIPRAYEDTNGHAPFLSVIENPEANAEDVLFTKNAINLGGTFATQGLPPFISSLLLPIEIIDADTNKNIVGETLEYCTGDNKTLKPDIGTGNFNYSWTFDDGNSIVEISNTRNLVLSDLKMSDIGEYKFVAEDMDDCAGEKFIGSFNINVFESATATKPIDINFCDTDNDGINQFDLNAEKSDEILNGLDKNIFEVLYFLDENDAINNTTANAIVDDKYTNTTPFDVKTIYARVHNKNAEAACFDITSFRIQVTGLPTPIEPEDFVLCDDTTSAGGNTDGITESFKLSDYDETNIMEDLTGFTITYHTTKVGAQTSNTTDAIDKNITRTVTNEETLFIRVENNNNPDCFDASKELKLVVAPIPVVKSNLVEIRQCINTTDDSTVINLSIANKNISDNPKGTFKYYEDSAGTDEIIDFVAYPININTIPPKSVWVKAISEHGCSDGLTELVLRIGKSPDNGYNETLPAVCDDFLDADGNDTENNSDTDGITTFNLDKNAIINNINPGVNIDVVFYEKESDRASSINPIDITNYRNKNIPNTTGNKFPIYYKLVSQTNNDCEGIGQFYIQITTVPKVSSNILPPLEECDTGLVDENFNNGINQNIDLTQRIEDLFLGTGQDKNDFDVTFYKTAESASIGNKSGTDYISTPESFTNDLPTDWIQGEASKQTVYLRVENKLSGCVNSHVSFDVIVNPIPIIANDEIPPVEICDLGKIDADPRNGEVYNIDLLSLIDEQNDILGSTRNPNEYTITYHRSESNLKDLSSAGVNTTNFNSARDRVLIDPITRISEETLFIRVLDKNTQCVFDLASIKVVVYPEPKLPLVIDNYSDCDNDNNGLGDDTDGIIENISLANKKAEILSNYPVEEHDNFKVTFHTSKDFATNGEEPIDENEYTNTHNNQTVFVRVQDTRTGCINDDLTFQIIVNPLPTFDEIETPQIVCLNDLPLRVTAENPVSVYDYSWKNELGEEISTDDFANIVQGGKYTVTATMKDGTNCSRTMEFTINESIIATLTDDDVTIIDDADNNSISIDNINQNLGIGDYEYSLEDEKGNIVRNYQDEALFENLEGGIYKILVNDKNGCGTAELLVSVIEFPKFFTPNNDGTNDTWIVKGANKTFYPKSSMHIFNRFGKLVAEIPIESQGWDGTYNGNLLPSDDYWFSISITDTKDNTRIRKGHFSLLRK